MVNTEYQESVEAFRVRARKWLAENMPRAVQHELPGEGENDDERWSRACELQKILYEGGFAGICFPREYGGLGLTRPYQEAFNEEAVEYEMPILLNIPTLSICAPTILEMGSEKQKREHIPRVIRGEETLVQFLSEPAGGSDLAAVTTRADRDGDSWVLNGSKVWTTSAYAADYALCLARTDWSVPKHQGLTMFLMKVDQPGVTVQRIEQVDGSTEFCQEFFDDVKLSDDEVVGEVNEGWQVALRQLHHERTAVGGGSPYTSGIGEWSSRKPSMDFRRLAETLGLSQDLRVRELVGQAVVHRTVQEQLISHVSEKVQQGALPQTAMALIRLFHAETDWLDSDIGLEISGAAALAGANDDHGLQLGRHYLSRQAISLGGGSTEMARNMISERMLDMPREYSPDIGVPFKDVKRSR